MPITSCNRLFKMNEQGIKRVVVLGPEGTGKSTLCKELAGHYHTSWCPEFARAYLLGHGINYTYDDLLTIARGQLAMEDECVSSMVSIQRSKNRPANINYISPLPIRHSLLFVDTDMYVMKAWSEFVFGKCHRWILEQIVERKYDLYLLCKPDLPWIKDELRECPDLHTRERLYNMYIDLMANQATPWSEISGSHEERLQKAIIAVDGLLAG